MKSLYKLLMLSYIFQTVCSIGSPFNTTILSKYGVSKETAQFIFTGPVFPPTLSQSLTFTNPFTLVPSTTVSIINLSWNQRLVVDVSISIVSNTGCTINLNKYLDSTTGANNIILLKVMVGVFDATYYSLTPQNFQYIEPSTTFIAQNISITNHEVYNIQFLVAYEDDYDPVVRSGIGAITTPNIQQTLSILYLTGYVTNILNLGLQGYLIKRIKYNFYTVIQHTHQKLTSYVAYFYSFTSGVVGSTFDAHSGHLKFPASFIYGLHSFKNMNNHLGLTLSFDLHPFSSSNNQALVAYYGVSQQLCPNNAIYYYLTDLSCYSPCPTNSYIVPQTITANSFYTCSPCQSPCSQCYSSATNCTVCIPNYRLSSFDALNTKKCNCPIGQYDSSGVCTNCNSSISYCAQCDNSSVCIRCEDSLYFNTTTNSCTCPNGQTPIVNTVSYKLNGITYYIDKVRCIFQILSQSCDIAMGFADFYLSCSCLMGGPVIDNRCN